MPKDSEDSHIDELRLDPADTLLGQLQRGRGAGFLRAMREEPAFVHSQLIECVTRDPRCETQIETRSDYYARLILLTGMNLDPLRRYLETTEEDRLGWETTLTIITLGRLAELGDSSAAFILRDYISYGALWDLALQKLALLPDPNVTDGLDDVLCKRFQTGQQMEDALSYGPFSDDGLTALWEKWRSANPCIAGLLDEVEQIERSYEGNNRQQPDYASKSIEELLAAANVGNNHHIAKTLLSRLRKADRNKYIAAFHADNPFGWWIAFQCLEAMNMVAPLYAFLLERLTPYLEALSSATMPDRLKRTMIDRILRRLPAELILPTARRWYISSEWDLQLTGEHLLRDHATEEDIPSARSALAQALLEQIRSTTDPCIEAYRAGRALDVLSRFSNIGPLPEVEQAYLTAAYSHERLRAANSMQKNAPSWFAVGYAYECLWDCEEETRAVGCESVAIDVPGALARLRELADDTLESEYIQEAARKRLALL